MDPQLLSDATTHDWEVRLGRQARRLRLRQLRSQEDVARAANVSLSAVKALEAGRGSSVRTLIQVARVLGRDDWLAGLAPPDPGVSPMQRLREQQRQAAHERRRAPRRPRQP